MRKFFAMVLLVAALPAQTPVPDQIREAATRAVAFIQTTQKTWPSKQGCTSCHHQFLPTIAFHRAREHGVAVDEQIANSSDRATYAGNVAALPMLKAAGHRVDDTMLLFGTFPVTPLTGSVLLGNLTTVRALLALGAPVHQRPAGSMPLTTAILGHHVEIACLLLEHRADVNQLDKTGFTSLLFPASTDFGDTPMVDLLLKSGARRDLLNNGGNTPAEVATKLKRGYLSAKLQ